jgi:hypothetical protein
MHTDGHARQYALILCASRKEPVVIAYVQQATIRPLNAAAD